jgi:thiamine-monophosphate kinase
MNTLKDIGEHSAIALLTANMKAVGDDCAVLPQSGSVHDLVLTSDPLIDQVHFTSSATPVQIGHKAVCRVLSDFAAMGAEPQYLLINVVAPPEQDVTVLQEIYAEFERLEKQFRFEVAGGDLAQGPVLELHVFGVGRVPSGTALLRSGATLGDHIYVTGPLGCSFKTGRHLDFEPRVEEGRWLRENGMVHAMMDISDGLATDLRHILKMSDVGAELDSEKIPCNGTLEEALFDGEDFELLLTVSEEDAEPFEKDWVERFGRRVFCIGRITGQPKELLLAGNPLDQKAFEHFKG